MKMIKRVLLKISGQALGSKESVFQIETLKYLAKEIHELQDQGLEIGIVTGGGNILRGNELASKHEFPRVVSDKMGMMATVINSLAISNTLKNEGCSISLYSAMNIEGVSNRFRAEMAIDDFKQKKVVLIAGGTGNPFFSTDTAAVLRALEINADCLIKATKVDGVYDKDPVSNKDAHKYQRLTFKTALEKKLQIMDLTAFTLCLNNKLSVMVYNFFRKGELKKIIKGDSDNCTYIYYK